MILLLSLAAAGLLAESKVPRAHPPSHRARTNLASYFGDADYPADALRRHEQGRVGFTLDVDATGRVAACRITESSGSATLDAATCRIARERARFTPALDRRGRPVPDRTASHVNWVLPAENSSARANLASYFSDADYPAEAILAEEQGTVGFELNIAADGSVSGCRVEQSSNSASLDEATCRILTSRARFRPALDSRGRAVPDRMKGRIRWVFPVELPDPGSTEEADLTSEFSSADYPPEAVRRRMEGQVGVHLSVSPDGRVTQCAVTRPSGSALLDARTCEVARARMRFSMIHDAAVADAPTVVDGFVRWALPAQ